MEGIQILYSNSILHDMNMINLTESVSNDSYGRYYLDTRRNFSKDRCRENHKEILIISDNLVDSLEKSLIVLDD